MMGREEFIRCLFSVVSDRAQTAYRDVIDEWQPEEPPVTELFAALGYQIAEDFRCADTDANLRTFSLIEKAMESGDQELITAVATGIIEALVTRAAQVEGLWAQVAPVLGRRSLHHAESWLS
ncbi:hypothetical protein F1536_29020 [Achromobacter xylosoxidans]|uniref:hypothetical protein n=1 Tax=Achromobacter TaxID=222 RepID=UPI001232586C|nr:hypothetical protein [Achromobacter xylosoxidans]KAA5918991.1 hypothetical protein F1536_29020 [Achromobacter xylosoxidans]